MNLTRLKHGVYKDARAPSDEHLEIRAAWLAYDPTRMAWDRLNGKSGGVVVSGESATLLHNIGEFRGSRIEFTTPTRRQTQQPNLRYRNRTLTRDDMTVRHGLSVTTAERTIADLVEERQDLCLVSHALGDAARESRLDTVRLTSFLEVLAGYALRATGTAKETEADCSDTLWNLQR